MLFKQGSTKWFGRIVAFPGHALGSGLTTDAAKELGLVAGTPVGTSLMDAHAGSMGVMESVPVADQESIEVDEKAICHRVGSPFLAALANDIHFLPDFHGNRPNIKGNDMWLNS